VTINTTFGNSRGLGATYGGTIIAAGVTATTQGDHSASVTQASRSRPSTLRKVQVSDR